MLIRLRNALVASMVGLAALAAGASACSGKKNTELVVAIDTDLRVPKDLNAVTVEIFANGQRIAGDTYDVGPSGLRLPATIGLVPNDPDKLTPVDVIITGRFSSNPDETQRRPRVIRKARVTFARDRVALVRMPLRFACYDATSCPDGQTCIAGSCKPVPVLEAASLPAYSDDLVFGPGGSPNGQGQCWNAAVCLASVRPLSPGPARCQYLVSTSDVPADGGPPAERDSGADGVPDGGAFFKSTDAAPGLTVVVSGPPGTLGFCQAEACSVPLDHDGDEGWFWVDEARTIVGVAQGLCDKIERDGLAVQATESCPTKVATLPVCLEGSGVDVPAEDASPTCSGGLSFCSGSCVDLQNDNTNCGSCGLTCAEMETCVAGKCSARGVDAGLP
ncbi:MAG: hypothetical protein HYV09_29820 [Deltaproteobacteria bacterium]|nr:hypothetical protein [Deltaproteobacteria bacterium]